MNADQKEALRLLKTARGQIEGIIKMIEDERYCIDVSNQVMASVSLLKKANGKILGQHLQHCVRNIENQDQLDEKIEELTKVMERMNK